MDRMKRYHNLLIYVFERNHKFGVIKSNVRLVD